MTQDPQAGDSATAAQLRAESDTFVAQLERLAALEHSKREIPPADPRFLALALEVEDAARALLNDAHGQTVIGDAAHVEGVQAPIALIPPDLSAAQIIAGWRDAERHLASLDPDSDEARAARLTIDAYRRAYQAVFADRKQDDQRGS